MVNPGPISAGKDSNVGVNGPTFTGGYFQTLTTSGTDFVVLCDFACTIVPVKRLAIQVGIADADIQVWTYVDKYQLVGILAGQCTIRAGDSHILIVDVPCDSMVIKVKPTIPGTTIRVGGGYAGASSSYSQVTTMAYESLTVTNSAITTLTRDLMSTVWTAMITVEDNPIRFRTDGGDPTLTEGHLIQAGDTININTTFDALNFKCIAIGNAAKIRVSYSR